MEHFAMLGAIMLELLFSIIIINSLLGKKEKIPLIWAILFVIIVTGYIVFVPDEWVNGCYLLTLLYVKIGYRVSWKEGFITVILSLVVGGLIELLCLFPFLFIFDGRWPDSVSKVLAALGSVILCYVLTKNSYLVFEKMVQEKRSMVYSSRDIQFDSYND